jgi:hypothetical protein
MPVKFPIVLEIGSDVPGTEPPIGLTRPYKFFQNVAVQEVIKRKKNQGASGGEIVEQIDLIAPVLEPAPEGMFAVRPGNGIGKIICVVGFCLVEIGRNAAELWGDVGCQ